MNTNNMLGIERALEQAGGGFIDKYRLMKTRLLDVEYEHWAAGFPEGNSHGRGHILRVLSYLDLLLGEDPLQHLDAYELFLAMMSVLYHDVGVLRQRKDHADISKAFLEGDAQDAYIINKIDKEIIAAAVVSHSSSKDIAAECSRFSPTELVGGHRARPAVVAALVRLSDELDEDYRRADPILQAKLNPPASSDFFWRFCQRVRGVRPDLPTKFIHFNLAFEPEDTKTYGTLPGGAIRHFIAFAAEKLAKINKERVVVNRFLPPELQYSGLHIDVKPLAQHASWRAPRTFVFNDQTPAQMFLNGFPELLEEPAMAVLQAVLQQIQQGQLAGADCELDKLNSVAADLPAQVRLQILYEKACVASLTAQALSAGDAARDPALDRGVSFVQSWLAAGEAGGFAAAGRTSSAEIHRLVEDHDFDTLLKERADKLPEAVMRVVSKRRSGGGGSGCVPYGSLIDTPTGVRAVEDLRVGDDILCTRLGNRAQRVSAKIVHIATSRSARCVKLNDVWMVTPAQPVHTARGWIEAKHVMSGEWISDGQGRQIPVSAVSSVDGYFEVFDLSTSDEAHNYAANGLLCHNKYPDHPDWDSKS